MLYSAIVHDGVSCYLWNETSIINAKIYGHAMNILMNADDYVKFVITNATLNDDGNMYAAYEDVT